MNFLSELAKEEEVIKLLLLKVRAQESFYEFIKQAWPHIEGAIPFIDGWHIDAIAEHLQACTNREIKKLLINIPPRTSKSSIVSIMWPAWSWLHRPEERFLYSSFAASLSLEHSVKCRRLICSHWYQNNWGHRFFIMKDQNTKGKFENDKTGYRIATSVGGASTGKGGSVLVADDPNNAKDGESEVKRESANKWLDQVWSTRANNPHDSVKVIVQQRLHENDVSGYIMDSLTSNEWTKLILPMEFEKGRKAKTVILPSTNGKIWEDPRTKEGAFLWPMVMAKPELDSKKKELGEYGYAGQFQQRPSPIGGGIIKGYYFEFWKKPKPPFLEQIIQSWDTALEAKDKHAYSACTTWGLFTDSEAISSLILLGVWRGRVEYPELREMASRLYYDYRDDGEVEIKPDGNHKPTLILVEAKASGHSLIQDLMRAGIPVTKFDPTRYGDKIQRVRLITHLLEAGRVYLPAIPPDYKRLRAFADTLYKNCLAFPNADSRDLVDTMTQVLLKLNTSGWLSHPDDPDRKSDIKVRHPFY